MAQYGSVGPVKGLVIKRFGIGQIFCFLLSLRSFLKGLLFWHLFHLDSVKIESQKLLMYVLIASLVFIGFFLT